MSKLSLERQHGVGKDKAREVATKVAERLKEKIQIDYRWEGDVLRFERTGARGTIEISDDLVRVEIELGLMLRPMKGVIEDKMKGYFDKYLPG